MARKSNGLTKETVDRFVIDAGAVYLNVGEVDERLLGATRGGNEFTIDQDIKLIEIDGVKGATMGARRIVESNATLKVNLLELTSENIMLAIAGADATDYTDPSITPAPTGASHDRIRRTRNISDMDFIKSISVVGKVSGSAENIIVTIYNALSDDSFELAFEDREEGALEITFTAHYDPENVEEEPWSIDFPKEIGA